ncbi:MAG: hypothetical protein IJ360_02070 [Clostridia bacterium]|nr:hypothetical protein [Clostridia bacterium]
MLKKNARHLSVKEICLFAVLGALMFVSKIVMEALPNIHLLGMLTVTYTIVFRKKALIPIYTYVLLNGLFAGFNAWWVPYLYIWTILWGATMLLPKNMPKAVACVVYPVICALHGLFFGVLYAPVQALMFGFTFEQTLAWISTGFTFDIIHTVGNFTVGLLIYPVSEALKRLTKNI